MKKQTSLALVLSGFGLFAAIGNANAQASITYSGEQENVDPKTESLPTEPDSFGWRNPTPVKTFDVDGDNIIGTDGYDGRAGTSLPAYITNYNKSGGGNPFGYVDDPTDPTGIDDARSGFYGGTDDRDLFWFQIDGSALDGQTLGVSIMFDTFGSGTQTYFLEQRDGGTGGAVLTAANSGLLTHDDDGYDWAFFEIDGAVAGDWFVLKSVRGTAGRSTFSQVAFDTAAVPEPSTFALLAGLLGLASVMLRRR
ncbi:hypothetical protein DDZ13_12110 [Coraliomargarita sinensis]|uniref:Ice-binding protein C-terminal domain-containing protein n=1 Tax=Coraliomargarita sinensis TaxID=2174842 RepID=A0A317ZJB7_9BACT|nr:PEP-CTERM sorting domain-containing protein [Coraliomargarita sinensis]PXA03431.1 hypothetical protein DDZ13_12110 [Coraliomargarita sinensis]